MASETRMAQYPGPANAVHARFVEMPEVGFLVEQARCAVLLARMLTGTDGVEPLPRLSTRSTS